MRKFLLLGTIFVTTSALAFGGIFGGGGSHKSSGVDAIGVHVNGKDNKPNIDIRTCDSETEELVGSECLPKCPDGIERNTDNSCSVCAGENANVYLSYMDDPCGTETLMNEQECEVGSDCWDGTGSETCCVNGKCRAGIYVYDDDAGESYACPATNKNFCESNVDCVKGTEFCSLMSAEGDCEKPNVGTCMDIGEKDVDYMDIMVENVGMLRISSTPFAWWAAENWCASQGMHLISIDENNVAVIAETLSESLSDKYDDIWVANISGDTCAPFSLQLSSSGIGSGAYLRDEALFALCK